MKDFAIRVLTARQGITHLFSVGQAGFIIKSASGQLLAWDLYLSECGERLEGNMGFKRLLPRLLTPEELVFDVVVTSHFHFDHYDPDTVPLLLSNPQTRLLAAYDCQELTESAHLNQDRISFLSPGDTVTVGDFTVHSVNCDHGTLAPKAIGAVIQVDGKTFYFTGDTCLRLDRAEEVTQFGKIDVLLAPINGAYGNLNEHDCAILSKALCPSLTVPCHYGMFARHGGNPGVFQQYMQTECPENAYLLMQMGEKYSFIEE